MHRIVSAILALVLLGCLASCAKKQEDEPLQFLPVLEEEYPVPEPLPAPPPEVQRDFKVSDECELSKLFEYASVEEYLSHNAGSVFITSSDVSSAPYDGSCLVGHYATFVTAHYSTSDEPDTEMLSSYLGVEITQEDIDAIIAGGPGFSYADATGAVRIEFSEAGWCIVRSIINPTESWEGVS